MQAAQKVGVYVRDKEHLAGGYWEKGKEKTYVKSYYISIFVGKKGSSASNFIKINLVISPHI